MLNNLSRYYFVGSTFKLNRVRSRIQDQNLKLFSEDKYLWLVFVTTSTVSITVIIIDFTIEFVFNNHY